MMPLTMAKEGEAAEIQRVGGKEDVRRHLENMGFKKYGIEIVFIPTHASSMEIKGAIDGYYQ